MARIVAATCVQPASTAEEAALAGDQVVAAKIVRSDHDRLDHAGLPDGLDELGEPLRVALAARVEAVDRADARNGDPPPSTATARLVLVPIRGSSG